MPATYKERNGLFNEDWTLGMAVLSAMVGVLHIGHTDDGVGDSVVDDSIHWHCDAVLGQQLNTNHIQEM